MEGGGVLKRHDTLHAAMFRMSRLNLTNVIPDMCQGDIVILKTIAGFVENAKEAENGVTVSAIVNELHIAPPAVSRAMNSLEEKGLILRSVNKSDRRNTLVTLTDLGWERQKENEEKIDAFMGKIFARVGEEKVEAIITYMNEIYEATREELDLLKKERVNK